MHCRHLIILVKLRIIKTTLMGMLITSNLRNKMNFINLIMSTMNQMLKNVKK
jgi:hypothetical protein